MCRIKSASDGQQPRTVELRAMNASSAGASVVPGVVEVMAPLIAAGDRPQLAAAISSTRKIE
jgi:hypothetical protein